jgi:hypothetical protein
MRTTITIDDALLSEAKVAAARSGRTLGEVIEDALRASLRQRPARTEAPVLGVLDAGPLQPGVDLDDTAALLDLMDDDERSGAGR